MEMTKPVEYPGVNVTQKINQQENENTQVVATSTPPREIALTFDDGPYGTSTSQVLDILEKENVPATFFLIGKNVELHPEQVKRELADGDIIGNHSYGHSRNLPTMSTSTLLADISRAEKVIVRATCASTTQVRIPHLFRPPYSRTSARMINEINSEGYVFAGWSIDPRDWDNTNSSSTIVSSVLKYTKDKSIVIFHDGHEIGTDYSRQNTIQALPTIIETLKKEGYTFVTIDKLLGTSPYRPSDPTVCNSK
jgi:peptidoglycan/xylan/chitin deacetylase (PgdA/CDA1 family)